MFLLSHVSSDPHTWSSSHMRDGPQDGPHEGLPPHMRGRSIASDPMNFLLSFLEFYKKKKKKIKNELND